MLQQQASNKKALAALRHQYGLDRPAPIRYLKWIEGAVQGDFGKAPANGLPVTTLIGTPLHNTAILLAVTLVLMFPLALLIGTDVGARTPELARRRSADRRPRPGVACPRLRSASR